MICRRAYDYSGIIADIKIVRELFYRKLVCVALYVFGNCSCIADTGKIYY